MLTFINLRGVKFRSFFQIITTAAKLLAMVLIFGLGMYYWGIGKFSYSFFFVMWYSSKFVDNFFEGAQIIWKTRFEDPYHHQEA